MNCISKLNITITSSRLNTTCYGKFRLFRIAALLGVFTLLPWPTAFGADLKPINFQQWRLPELAPSPKLNQMDRKKAEIGKKLFFDPRLSGDGKMSCATCHDPEKGWADGLATAKGHDGKILARATPSIINVGFNDILMWDGRAKTLEDQALGPITNPEEMHNSVPQLIKTLKEIPGYVELFRQAYYGLPINSLTIKNSIAMYQRLVVAKNSKFDRWLAGDTAALNEQELLGLDVFTNEQKGNCARCHRPPNFTDNGFHNIGLKSFADAKPDLGRNNVIQVDITKGAFKTPTLRNVALTAPYFHDGSAKNLQEVIRHYMSGGIVKTNLSPNMKVLKINQEEREALLAFLNALTGTIDPQLSSYTLP